MSIKNKDNFTEKIITNTNYPMIGSPTFKLFDPIIAKKVQEEGRSILKMVLKYTNI